MKTVPIEEIPGKVEPVEKESFYRRQAWIDLLRSPEAPRQCRYNMKTATRYCAIGVYHHLVIKGDGGWMSHLSNKVSSKIVHLNDDKYLTFPEIADWLEKNT